MPWPVMRIAPKPRCPTGNSAGVFWGDMLTYRVVSMKDGTFGVEVVVPGTYPTTFTKFAAEAEAEAWITSA
jgi:hypothetical protein